METTTINKLCLVPGLGTLIGAGTIAYHLPLVAFKSGAIEVSFFSNFLAQNQILNEQTNGIRDWYARRGSALKIEVFSHLKQVGIGLIRLLPVIGAIFLVWKDFCETLPSEAYVNQLCIIPGLGTVIGFLTLLDNPPLITIGRVFLLVIIKGLFVLQNNNILGPFPTELRDRNIQNYNQQKGETMMNIRMTVIGFIRLIPVIGGATLALNDRYHMISFMPTPGT